MKAIYIFITFGIITLSSCKSQKNIISQADLDAFNTMVKSKQFYIESDWAYPQTTAAMQNVLNSGLLQPGSGAGSISLVGNANFLKVSGDSISSYLPYYGERQMQIAYGGGDSAIEFKGVAKNYEIQQNDDNSYTISFEAKSNAENFNVYIRLSFNLKSNIQLNGTSRNSIRYSGSVKATTSKQ